MALYYKIMAKGPGGERVVQQFLDGHEVDNYEMAVFHATELAQKQCTMTGDEWVGWVERYETESRD